MPRVGQPGTDPGIGRLEETILHLLTHAGGVAEVFRMNVMSTLSKGVCAADTDRRFEAARRAVSTAGQVQFTLAYESARDSTTDQMIGRFYDGTVREVIGALWMVEEPAVRRAAADAFEAVMIEGGLSNSPSGIRWKIHNACKDAVRVKGRWADRLDDEVVDAADESVNEIMVSIISASARMARTGVALCAATVAMLELSGRGSLKDALKDARRVVPEYASAAINDEAGFVVFKLLEEVSRQTRHRRGTSAWKEMARVARQRAAVQAAYVMAGDIFKAVYGAAIRGAYRTTTQKTLFETSYPAVLQEVAAKEAAGPQPNHATMYGFADAGMIDYRAFTDSSGDSGLVGLYEATYRAAYAVALKRARQICQGGRGAAGGRN